MGYLIIMGVFTWEEVSNGRAGFYIIVAVSAIIACAFWSFFNMEFRITTVGVEASMPPFSYGVKFEEIEDVYIYKVPWWMGWGLRMWGRRIGFISRHGPALAIKKKSGVFRKLILSTKDPESFAGMIKMR
jgi:hypothetical protein